MRLRCMLCLLNLLAGSAIGCSPGLESYADVTDLRVLGMRADPPEILSDTPVALNTNVTALVVDPRGGPLQYTWSLCPVQSTLACDDFNDLIEILDATTQSVLRQLRGIQVSGTVNPSVADANTPSFYPVPAFNPSLAAPALYGNDITPAVWLYDELDQTLLNLGLGSWPSAILTLVSSHGDTLVATKRMVLGIADYNSIAGPFAAATGVTLCGSTTTSPNCLSIPAKVPNSNPEWNSVLRTSVNPNTGVWAQVGNLLLLDANTQVRLQPVAAPGSRQTYQTLRGNLQTGQLEVETVTEMLSISWFFTAGAIENNLTQPLMQPTLENVYTSPATYGTTPAALWLVMRDQRGGESWLSMVVAPNG